MKPETLDQIKQVLADAQKVLVIQADNPDADSLGSALALEQLLGEQGKQVYLFCGVGIPEYLKHIPGWDRVMTGLPSQFDVSVIVDTSTLSLLAKAQADGNAALLTKRPCIVLDHHAESDESIHFATVTLNNPDMSSTGELIYTLATAFGWEVGLTAGEYVAAAILGDTQGLSNESTIANTYRVMADLVDVGVSRPKLEELRREYGKMDPRIFKYKATLIERTEHHADGHLALVTIPQDEINTYSPLYNPAPLIQGDMLQTVNVQVAVVIKHYDDGRILASIRCNQPAPVAADLAVHFGGGGHPHAAGFKIENGRPLNEVKSECIRYCSELISKLDLKDARNETIQYSF